MSRVFIQGEEFRNIDFTASPAAKGDYENCTFHNCVFTGADLSDFVFAECEFTNCDLSLAKLHNTAFRDARFKSSKLVGLHFDDCNEFLLSASFEDCPMNLSSFCQKRWKHTLFRRCNLQETDFTGADLTSATFDECDLALAAFEGTTLENTDFRSAYNFSIDPDRNRIKYARFSLAGLPGLLHKYDLGIEE